MGELNGRVALVTGGGRGLGAAVALALAEAGATVAVLGRNAATLNDVSQVIGARGGQAMAVVADVAHWEQTRAAIAEVEMTLGAISILINNASIVTAIGPVAQVDPAAWALNLAVDLNGPFFCIRAALAGMRTQGWGRIINVTSGAGPGAAAYSIAKSGLNLLTSMLATELVGSGVVPIAVSPGMMDTEMQAELRANPLPDTDGFRAAHAQGLLRSPAEPATLIRWLCGPAGEAFAGQVVSASAPEIRAQAGLPELTPHPPHP